ncbi:phosphotransferase [Paraferrimonas sedimenticola]|uniref:Aminoglycoside phosphotransferase domain-containing protein n=1 Tax=Paraferrimonas sedimenticola TaxID=375674 RepID=A0AA37VWV1_9GAMM|nr:phosphotransferase [Paraferrimonas sedimenticola]GLP96444.1 hypothetical protein GCM10007895_17500 [Paraferrimonas sedimenticola]
MQWLEGLLKSAGFQEPIESIQALHMGLSNQHYKVVSTQGSAWHVRLLTDKTQAWLNRQHERTVWQAAAKAAISPTPVLMSDELSVCQWVEQRSLPEHLLEGHLDRLISEFAKLEVSLPKMELDARLSLYQQLCQPLGLSAEAQVASVAKRAIVQLNSAPVAWGLCHLDWHSGNLLYDGLDCYLIDYEYAATAPLALELASLMLGGLLGKAKKYDWTQRIVDIHQDAQPTTELAPITQRQMQGALALMQCYSWYWYQLMPQAPDAQTQSETLLSDISNWNF